MVAPSMGSVTLQHTETDTEPECTVVFGGGRMTKTGKMDLRRVEIEFDMCDYSRTMPLPGGGGLKTVYQVEASYEGDMSKYLKWLEREWNATGLCPHPGFYVAKDSEWLAGLPDRVRDSGGNHYVVAGRDGYVELIAKQFQWREWMWTEGRREDVPDAAPVVGSGEGVS
jgi:hypothetical protein